MMIGFCIDLFVLAFLFDSGAPLAFGPQAASPAPQYIVNNKTSFQTWSL